VSAFPEPRDEASPRIPSGWRAGAIVIVALLVAVGVGTLIAKAAGFSRVRDSIAEAESAWFLVCFFAEVAAFAAYAVVVREALHWRGGPRVRYGLSVHVTLASLGATRVVAAAGAGGLAVTYWCFRRARFATRDALVRVLGLNTLVYLVFGVGAWVAALLAALGVLGEAPLALTLPWLLLVPICLVAARYATDPDRGTPRDPTKGSLPRRSLAYAISGAAWVRQIAPEPPGRRSLLAGAVYWSGDVVCLWAALQSVGVSLPLAELVLAYATGYAAMVLPLPLAGVGGVDAAMTFALTAVGVSLAPALVGVAVYRLFAFWIPTIPALAALVLLPRAGRGLQQAAVTAA
jgi:putative heme transporter